MEGNTLFTVRVTLGVSAETAERAQLLASAAVRSLADRPGIEHAAIDIEASPLFDASAFEQLPGQLAIETDPRTGEILRVLRGIGEDDRS